MKEKFHSCLERHIKIIAEEQKMDKGSDNELTDEQVSKIWRESYDECFRTDAKKINGHERTMIVAMDKNGFLHRKNII